MSTPRKWYVARALTSFSALQEVVNDLTEAEVLACLDIESASLRRKSIIDRLISRAARLHELSYVSHLKEKFHHGTSFVQDHDPR